MDEQAKLAKRIAEICKEFDDRMASVGVKHARIELARALARSEAAQHSVQADGTETWRKDDLISDGYQSISAWCPNGCGKTMQVVRTGKFQCSVCE